MLPLLCHPERDDPCTMTKHDGEEHWGMQTGPKAPTDGRRLKLKGHLVRSGVPAGPTALRSQAAGLREGDKSREILRSRDHGATIPSAPVRFLLLPQHPYSGGLGKQ